MVTGIDGGRRRRRILNKGRITANSSASLFLSSFVVQLRRHGRRQRFGSPHPTQSTGIAGGPKAATASRTRASST